MSYLNRFKTLILFPLLISCTKSGNQKNVLIEQKFILDSIIKYEEFKKIKDKDSRIHISGPVIAFFMTPEKSATFHNYPKIDSSYKIYPRIGPHLKNPQPVRLIPINGIRKLTLIKDSGYQIEFSDTIAKVAVYTNSNTRLLWCDSTSEGYSCDTLKPNTQLAEYFFKLSNNNNPF